MHYIIAEEIDKKQHARTMEAAWRLCRPLRSARVNKRVRSSQGRFSSECIDEPSHLCPY